MRIKVLTISPKTYVPVMARMQVRVNGKLSTWSYNANQASISQTLYGGSYSPERDSAMIGNY